MYHFSTNLYNQRRLFMIWVQKRPTTPARRNPTVRQNSLVLEHDVEALLIPLMKFLGLCLTNMEMISSPMMMVLAILKGSMAMGNDLMNIWTLLTDLGTKEEPQAKHGGHLCMIHSNPGAHHGEEIEDIYVG